MNVTPGGQYALLRPWHFPRPPPLTLSPSKPAVPAEKKDLPILFQPVKTFGKKRASARTIKHRAEFDPVDATGFFTPKINKMEVIFL